MGWVIRSKNRVLGRDIRRFFSSTETKFFLAFTLGLFTVYSLIDLVTNPTLAQLGYGFFSDYSLDQKLALLGVHSLEGLRNASAGIQFFVALFLAFSAYALTRIVVEPLELVRQKQKYFAANVSHELRTPLSVLKTTAEVARMYREMLTTEQVMDLTKSITEEVDRMANIIEFFIHFAAFENNMKLEMSPVDITHVIKKTKNLLSTQAAAQGVSIEIHASTPIKVWGNFTALEEMLVNLTKNAIANSTRGSTVILSAENFHLYSALSITDTGRGIPESDLPHIFEVFYKGANGAKGGSGLGLTIVREIVKMHDASIDVESTEGKGSKFLVRFPK